MLRAAASNILVLLTFGQPLFKVLFNLSKRCRGSERRLNNTVSASVLPSVFNLPHQTVLSIFRLSPENCIFIFKQIFMIPFYHVRAEKHVNYSLLPPLHIKNL